MVAESVECEGFCDLQVNGFAGIDFNDPALTDGQVQDAAAGWSATGVTRFLATLISAAAGSVRGMRSCSCQEQGPRRRRHSHGGPVHLAGKTAHAARTSGRR